MFNIIEFYEQLGELIQENEYLRKKNMELKRKDKEHRDYIDNLYKQTQNQIADVLVGLINIK